MGFERREGTKKQKGGGERRADVVNSDFDGTPPSPSPSLSQTSGGGDRKFISSSRAQRFAAEKIKRERDRWPEIIARGGEGKT